MARKFQLLPPVKKPVDPPPEKFKLNEQTFLAALNHFAENGWFIDVQHSQFGWRCEIKWQRAERFTPEMHKDWCLLCSDSGYGHKDAISALSVAWRKHLDQMKVWQERHADSEQRPPRLEIVA